MAYWHHGVWGGLPCATDMITDNFFAASSSNFKISNAKVLLSSVVNWHWYFLMNLPWYLGKISRNKVGSSDPSVYPIAHFYFYYGWQNKLVKDSTSSDGIFHAASALIQFVLFLKHICCPLFVDKSFVKSYYNIKKCHGSISSLLQQTHQRKNIKCDFS